MLKTGEFLGDRYEILELIGSGGMADVYKAKCHKLNRMVAIKVLKKEFCTDRNFVSRFKIEGQSAAGLLHANIVNIYDVGDEGDIHYIVMELVEGVTLKEFIQRKGRLEIRESIGIAIQIAQGIAAAHEQGIIHRDIKPQNVIISNDGKAKVADFGIAKVPSANTINSDAVGSVYYFSPEQARGGYCDERSDIYSLGITLYEMLTGKLPFDGDNNVAIALAHLNDEITPPREIEPMIPISLEKIILKATQKKQERRYATVNDLISDLRKALFMPETDFVEMTPISNSSPTVLISDGDISTIRQNSRVTLIDEASVINEDFDEDIETTSNEEDDNNEDEGNENTLFDKIILAVGIFVAAIIVIIAVFLLVQFIKGNTASTDKTTEATESTGIDSKQTKMPNLIGKTQEEAYELLKEHNLGIQREYGISEEYAVGYVYAQEFKEDTIIDKNQKVKVWISEGSEFIDIPDDLIGQKYAAVRLKLLDLKFVVEPEYEFSDEYEKDYVINTSPEPGVGKLKKGDTITVYVSKGEEIIMIKVPELRLYTLDEAERELAKLGLKIGEVTEEYSNTYDVGVIMSQSVEKNQEIEYGEKIDVVISKGKEFASVPDLEGMTEEEAEKALEEEGLQLGKVTEDYSDEIEEGLVISQNVEKKTDAKIDSKVDIVISKGIEKVKVPVLIGLTADEAKRELEKAGLKLGAISEKEKEGAIPGRCIESSVLSNEEVDKGTSIEIVIAKEIVITPPPTEAPTIPEQPETEAQTVGQTQEQQP